MQVQHKAVQDLLGLGRDFIVLNFQKQQDHVGKENKLGTQLLGYVVGASHHPEEWP